MTKVSQRKIKLM